MDMDLNALERILYDRQIIYQYEPIVIWDE
jgi:hypothetical protein